VINCGMISILLGVIGLCLGSFLNVVIARYPVMLMRQWQAESHEWLQLPARSEQPPFNLVRPRSHCPQCQHRLLFWQNIPLVSYLILRGRCHFCRQRISIQYPIIEGLTALALLAVFFKFGWQAKTYALWLMTLGLITLSGIDWKSRLLPDAMTLGLLWIGLMVNIGGLFTPLDDAVLGAVTGYILLWTVAALFRLVRKKQGLGPGDFKMLAMFGAWAGVMQMLYILVIAVLLSLVINLLLLAFKKISYDQPVPFGPWLGIAGWMVLWVMH